MALLDNLKIPTKTLSDLYKLQDYIDDFTSIATQVDTNTTKVNTATSNIGTMTNLDTTIKTSLVDAVNEVVAGKASNASVTNVSDDVGNIANLQTTDKSNVVNAINNVEAQIVETADCRVLLVSDMHLDSMSWFTLNANDRLAIIIEAINKENRKRPLDAVFVLGDCSSTDTTDLSNSYSWFEECVEQYLPRINVPYYVLHGNHDEISDAQWATWFPQGKNFTVVIGGYAFICVDNFSGAPDADNRGAGDSQAAINISWFNTQVTKLKDKKIFVLGHYISNAFDTALVNAIGNNSNIVCAFEGHGHNSTITTLSNGKKVFMDGFCAYGTADNATGYWRFQNLELRSGSMITENQYVEYTYPTNGHFQDDSTASTTTLLSNITQVSDILLNSTERNKFIAMDCGTFTPSLKGNTTAGSASYSGTRYGDYVRFGNLVWFSVRFDVSSTSGAGGYWHIGGLPFEGRYQSRDRYQCVSGSCSIDGVGNSWQVSGNDIVLKNSSGTNAIPVSTISSTTYFQCSGVYVI